MVVDRRRFFESGYCYHVINRGAQRQTLLFNDDDYREFEALMKDAEHAEHSLRGPGCPPKRRR